MLDDGGVSIIPFSLFSSESPPRWTTQTWFWPSTATPVIEPSTHDCSWKGRGQSACTWYFGAPCVETFGPNSIKPPAATTIAKQVRLKPDAAPDSRIILASRTSGRLGSCAVKYTSILFVVAACLVVPVQP